MKTVEHWIGGASTPGSSTRTGDVYNPATGQVQARVLLAEPADVDDAVQTAKKAYAAWQDVSLTRRARIMFAFRELIERHLDDIARVVSAEHGKVVSDAKGEVIRGLEVVEFACGIPQLLKGEFSDLVSTDVDALLDHPDVAAISFVGSTPIASYVHRRASEQGKRVQALGGAKNNAVVLPDADMDFAANHITAAGYGPAGERCMAISAVVAVGTAEDEIIARLRQKAEESKVGPGDDASSDMGPIVTQQARDRIAGYVNRGEQAGAALVVDGRGLVVEGHEEGFFIGPALFDHVGTDMDIYTDEIFGPVLVVLRADSLAQAIELINAKSLRQRRQGHHDPVAGHAGHRAPPGAHALSHRGLRSDR